MDLNLKENNIIFIEESVFLTNEFYSFLKELFSEIGNRKLNIYIENTIEDSITNYKDTFNTRKAYTLEGFIDLLRQRGFIKKIDTKGYFDLQPIDTVIHENKDAHILFITQKESVYKSLSKLKDDFSNIILSRLIRGNLVEWEAKQTYSEDAFYIDQDIYVNRVEINQIDYVYSPKYGHLKLDKSKGFKGGEGVLYRTYNNQLCKLYFEEHQTYVNYKKLEQMLEIDVYNPYINWPKDIIYYKNDFVGYVMDEIKEAQSLDVMRINMFKGYSIFDLYILSYHLLKNIHYLHEKDILIGDLKMDNILVKSPEEVYLVDCGCYQINDYACDVCHPEYTKKIYTTEELKTKLRSFEDEYYPINKIIFELLISKNPHYDRQSGEVNVENKDNFSFPLNLQEIKEFTHEMKMWAMLPNRLREFFYYYFKENKVTYLSEWITELEIFIENAKRKKGER